MGAAADAAASLFPQPGQNAKATDTSSWQRWHFTNRYYAAARLGFGVALLAAGFDRLVDGR